MSPLVLLLLMAALQGLTEFMPVSSSGHLVLLRSYVEGGEKLRQGATVEVFLHLGTLLTILWVYRRQLAQITAGVFRRGPDPAVQQRLAFLVAVGTLPVVLVGLLLRNQVENLFSQPDLASLALIITGTLLFLSRWITPGEKGLRDLTVRGALLIGCFQAFAVVPGFSRSGFTILAGMALGLRAERAAAFSFLLAIPALIGAGVLKAALLESMGGLDWRLFKFAVPAVLVSFAVGLLSLVILIRITRARRLQVFAPYCWLAGLTGLLLSLNP